MLTSELFESLKDVCPVCGCTPCNCTHIVNESQLNEASYRDVIRLLLDKFYADMGISPKGGHWFGPLDVKSPGTRVWTRGDGTRYRDPGFIGPGYYSRSEPNKAGVIAQKFWQWLQKQPGVKSLGQISGEFGSSKFSDIVVYKGLYFSGGRNGVEFGSASRFKNPRSVWRHKAPEQGVSEGEVVPFPKKEKPKAKPVHCPKCGGEMQCGKIDGQRVKVCVPCLTYIKDKNVEEGKWHVSPSGVKTNMSPTDDDYDINYGKDGGVAKFRKSQGLDVKTGAKKDVEEDSDPCWKGYKQVGMKDKAGKTVPNCVPKNT